MPLEDGVCFAYQECVCVCGIADGLVHQEDMAPLLSD